MMHGNSPELRALRELFQTCDPAPRSAVAAAYAAAGHVRDPGGDAALELVGDSADEPVSGRVRAWRDHPWSRVLTFMMPGRVVEMDLVSSTPGMMCAHGVVVSRSGQATPEGDLVVRHPNGEVSGALDEHGAFQLDDVPCGPVRVALHPAGRAPVVADWLVC